MVVAAAADAACAQWVLEEADAVAAGIGVIAEVGDDPAAGGDPGVAGNVGRGV